VEHAGCFGGLKWSKFLRNSMSENRIARRPQTVGMISILAALLVPS